MLLLPPAPNAPTEISAFPFSRLQPGPGCPLHQLNRLPPPAAQLLAAPWLAPHTRHVPPPSLFEDGFSPTSVTFSQEDNMLRFGQAVLCCRRGVEVTQPSPELGHSKSFGDNQHPLPLTPMLVLLPSSLQQSNTSNAQVRRGRGHGNSS